MKAITSGNRSWLDLVVTVAILATCVVIVAAHWPKLFPRSRIPAVPKASVSLVGATLKGSSSAPVVLIEFSDYVCPFCKRSETEVLPKLAEEYIESGRVQLAFKQHPLEKLHPGATKAAEAALCAGREGKFWQMHAALFSDQKQVDHASLTARATALALDEQSFEACLDGQLAAQVQSDVREAEGLGLSVTPAFLIGRREASGLVKVVTVLTGAQPVQKFKEAFDRALGSSESMALYGYAWFGGALGLLAVIGLASRLRKRIRTRTTL